MLISETHNFIFIAIPKTGTHSVREVLKPYSTDEHVGNGGGVSTPHKSRFPEFANIGHGHLSMNQMSSVIECTKYFSFCVFRNPFDRAVSLWSFYTRYMTVKPDILTFYRNQSLDKQILFRPQASFICDPAVDYIIKFEDYQKGFDYVCDQLSIPRVALPKINESRHDDYESYHIQYPELRELILQRYGVDYEIWKKL